MAFPTSPDELTTEWLTEVLGYNVSHFQVEAFGEGAGIIGMVTRLHLDSVGGPKSVIAKFPSPAEENRAVAATYDMYGREISFYRDIADRISLRVPACYHTDHDPETNTFVILMEDLQDWTIGDQVAGCSEEEAMQVIDGIARLHGDTWRTDIDIVSHNNPSQRDGMIGGFGVGWPVVQAEFPDLIPESAANIGDRVPANVGKLLNRMTEDPVCISHADVRLDNVFFGDGEIALVDWQSVCTSAPEQDLAYFVTQSLSDDVRNARDWVLLYHEALISNGVNDYPLDQCRERYRVSALYLVCYAAIIAGTLDLGNERGRALGRTLFGNAMRSLDELNAFELLK